MNERELKKWLKQNDEKLKSIAYCFVALMKKHIYSFKNDYSSDELLYAYQFFRENKDEILRDLGVEFADNDKFIDFCTTFFLIMQSIKSSEEIKIAINNERIKK